MFSPARIERWQRILAEAAEQSTRGILPEFSPAMMFGDACARVSPQSLSLIPWEGERAMGLRSALQAAPGLGGTNAVQKVNLFIGPEGGFTRKRSSRPKRMACCRLRWDRGS